MSRSGKTQGYGGARPKHQPSRGSHRDSFDSSDCGSDDSQKVLVKGIPTSLNSEFLKLLFESRRRGGGEISEMEYEEGSGEAVITFAEEDVTSRVVQKGRFAHEGAEMTAEIYVPPRRDHRKVHISGITKSTSLHMLECYLENERYSGGDFISVQYDNDSEAVVTFEEESVSWSFLNHPTPHELDGAVLTISPYTEEPVDPCTVVVSGIKPGIGEEMLRLTLESKRVCGGGPLADLQYDSAAGEALVTYADEDVAARVLEKQQFAVSSNEKPMTVSRPKPKKKKVPTATLR